MSTVLVTGGSGFIGRNLIETLLFRGHRVRCLVRNPKANVILEDLGGELIAGDLHDHADQASRSEESSPLLGTPGRGLGRVDYFFSSIRIEATCTKPMKFLPSFS